MREGKIVTDFYAAPPSYPAYIEKVMELKTRFPFIQVFPIGQSVLGRQILAMSIGNTSKTSLMAGAFHAQEWLTATLIIRYFEDACIAFSQKKPLCGSVINLALSTRGLIAVPMVNPDGVQIALTGPLSAMHLCHSTQQIQTKSPVLWQANANGVDINHNFDAGFTILRAMEKASGITSPSPSQYGGEFPNSEPETRAIVKLIRKYYVETLYAFHSQGEEIFYEYGINTPPKSVYIAKLIAQTSGYSLVKNGGLCSHGGCKDFFIEKYSRPGFTVEVGKGKNPLPISDLPSIYERLKQAMVIMTII